ncbi:universal stress protein [Ideonella lacteola]
MLRVLVPVDNSTNALRAVRHAMAEYQRDHQLELHLLNVQPTLSQHVARFLSRRDRSDWHESQANMALAGAKAELDQSRVPYQTHWTVGDRAQAICQMAQRLKAHHIVMGTARKNSITRMLEDSVTHRVLEETPVPVEVVTGPAVSRIERWGVPMGALGVATGLLWLAAD